MLSVSFPAKSKSAQPAPTQVEVVTAPVPGWALLIALIVACLFTAAMTGLSFRTAPTSADWKRLMGQRTDDHGYAMGQIFSKRANQADLVILGTSAAREALPNDSELAAKLLGRHAVLQGVSNLATSSQSLIDTLYLADAASPRPGQLFVVFLSFSSLRRNNPFDLMERGYYFHAPQVLIEKYANRGAFPEHWRNPFNRLLYQWRAIRQKWGRQLDYRFNHWITERVYGRSISPYHSHRHGAKTLPSQVKKAPLFNQLRLDFNRNYSANLSYGVPALEALATLLKRSGARLVIAEPPEFNGELRERFPNEYRQFITRIQAVQHEFGLERLNLNDRIIWSNADFVDLVHVSQTGREKWTRALGDWLRTGEQTASFRQ